MSNYNAIGKKPITISIEANNLERMIEENNNTQEIKNQNRYDINDFKKQHLDVFYFFCLFKKKFFNFFILFAQ